MENLLKEIGLILVGWLLGLLAPVIVDQIRSKREAKVVKAALFTELQEFQYRLLLIIFRIESKHGVLNKVFFQWAQKIMVGYNGVNSSEALLKTIGPLLELTDEQLLVYSEKTKQQEKPNSGLELKKHTISLIDLDLDFLSRFDPTLRANLIEIKTRVGFLNEIVDDARYYFRLSFQKDISPTNYDIAHKNMINSYHTYSVQARIAIDLISKVLANK